MDWFKGKLEPESPIFNGKIYGFRLKFSLKPIQSFHRPSCAWYWQRSTPLPRPLLRRSGSSAVSSRLDPTKKTPVGRRGIAMSEGGPLAVINGLRIYDLKALVIIRKLEELRSRNLKHSNWAQRASFPSWNLGKSTYLELLLLVVEVVVPLMLSLRWIYRHNRSTQSPGCRHSHFSP